MVTRMLDAQGNRDKLLESQADEAFAPYLGGVTFVIWSQNQEPYIFGVSAVTPVTRARHARRLRSARRT
jgi:hypothetical protein